MSIVRQVWLYCDGAECVADGDAANNDQLHHTAAAARQWARGREWVSRGGRDLCPMCAEAEAKPRGSR